AGADDEDFTDRGVFGHGWEQVRKRVAGRLNFEVCGRDHAACKGHGGQTSHIEGVTPVFCGLGGF
ncbi:MAG: hypothetical protein ABI600_04125, partial [Luteolibacter sp.]